MKNKDLAKEKSSDCKNNKTPSRRKSYLINPDFQINFILRNLILAIGVISLLYLSNTYLFWTFVAKGKQIGLNPEHIFFRFIETQRRKMNMVFLFTALAVTALISWFGLRMSHRIAGPLHQLKQYFLHYKERGNKPLAFRKGDYFTDIPPVINAALQAKINLDSDQKQKAG